MGILAGTILYPSISESKKKKFSLWAVRVVMVVLIVVAFALTTKNFCESPIPFPNWAHRQRTSYTMLTM